MPEQIIEEFDLESGIKLQTVETSHLYDLVALAYHKKSGIIISASSDKTIELHNLETGVLLDTLGDKMNKISAIDVRPNGKQIISAGVTSINLWSTQ